MDEMLKVTYIGPEKEITVNVAGGFRVVLAQGIPRFIPAQYAECFLGPDFRVGEFVAFPTQPETNDPLLEE